MSFLKLPDPRQRDQTRAEPDLGCHSERNSKPSANKLTDAQTAKRPNKLALRVLPRLATDRAESEPAVKIDPATDVAMGEVEKRSPRTQLRVPKRRNVTANTGKAKNNMDTELLIRANL